MVPDIVQPTPAIRAKADLVLESLTEVVQMITANELSFSPT